MAKPTFDVLPLSAETRAALAKMGYEHPTPVQRAVFEPATRGKDLVVQARTGTGKTTAFGLPIVEQAVRRSQKAVQVLCLCPTRELALQVAAEIEKLGENRAIVPVAIYGGAPMGKQLDALAAGAQVVVGTPGRVLDHIRRGSLDTSTIRTLVLDEADEMLSMGFERELSAILDSLPKDRQTLLFSATLPPDIERMAKDRLRSPEFITLSGDAIGALSITHYVYFVLEDKVSTLLKVIEVENPESAVIFCNTKAETEVVSAALQRAGYDADWLNGDLPQSDRETVMGRIRRSELRFLVATDVAARGIDISHLTHVINYDFPDSSEQYVHRTGRTGRAGRTGTAISLVRPQDVGNVYLLRLTYKIKPFERTLPSAGELKTRREADIVQAIVDSYQSRPAHPDDLSLARRLLSHDQAENIVAQLLRDRLGERAVTAESAAAARRAKNPPAEAEPRAAAEARAERPRRDRDDRPRFDRRDDRPRDDRPRDDRPRDGGPRDGGPREARPRDDRPRDDRPRDDRPREERRDERPRRDERDERPRGERRDDRREAPAVAAPQQPVAAPVAHTPAPPVAAPAPRAAEAERQVGAAAEPTTAAPPRVESEPSARPEQGDRPPHREGERRRRGSFGRDRDRQPQGDEPFRYTVSEPDATNYTKPAHTSAAPPERPSDLVNWHPAEEEGDDRPIFTGAGGERRRRAATPLPPEVSPQPPAAAASGEAPVEGEGDDDSDVLEQDESYGVVFVDVGRRDGARPADLQRVLRDRGGISRRETGRIRVRDKHALVSVRREVMAKAIEALTGAEIAGKTVKAEPARERSAEAT